MRTAVLTSLCSVCLLVAPPAWAQEDDGEPGPIIAQAETSYVGARVLKQGAELFGGSVAPGLYFGEDKEAEDVYRYATWQGDTLFFGAESPETGNTVDGVVEFYWFESSVPKSADFYVVVVKVKSGPNTTGDWMLSAEDGGWFSSWIYDLNPSQMVQVDLDDTGDYGAIRWDWCVPFQNYPMEPLQTIQVEQSYSAGFDLEAGAEAGVDGKVPFAEGSFLKDASLGATIQGKGYFNKKFAVSSNYTITLYKWEMLVQGGAQGMKWNLVITKDGSAGTSSAYHEYFVVVQAPQGTMARIDDIRIAANFRKSITLWPDKEEALSVTVKDLSFTPPLEIECYAGDTPPSSQLCASGDGLCNDLKPVCIEGAWVCEFPEDYEEDEVSCDGIDNDCDGWVDEDLVDLCDEGCGEGLSFCFDGDWSECSESPSKEVCNGFDDDCDGDVDEDLEELCTTECGNAVRLCDDGVWGECLAGTPTDEVCDGVDNNCDGEVDESILQACSNECGSGFQKCDDGEWGQCAIPGVLEACDGIDNDCNGQTDEGLFRGCSTACGSGEEFCTNGIWYGCDAELPTIDLCSDGIDQDCDGTVDNGPDCAGSDGGKDETGGEDPDTGTPFDPGLPGSSSPGQPGDEAAAEDEQPQIVVNTGDGGCAGSGDPGSPLGPWAPAGLALLALGAATLRRRA